MNTVIVIESISVNKQDAQYVLSVNLTTREVEWCNDMYVLLVPRGLSPFDQSNILTYSTKALVIPILTSQSY